jgi:signal transduction histidine kinase
MEVANQIFFIVFALITFAILLSAIPQFQAQRSDWPSIYWPLSSGFYTLSALSFGLALWVNKFLLTIANTSLLMSSLALVFLYRSWGEKPFTKIQTLLIWLIPLGIAILYEPLRVTPDTFLQRVALITIAQEIFVTWQLWELIKFYKKDRPRIVSWLIFLTMFTLMGNIFRTYRILTGDGPTNIFLYTEDAFALGLRWITYASNIMTFVALGMFYLQRQLVKENEIASTLISTKIENEKINELLKEKERLIYGLMKANKTAATGALSASIAHELNQPLGASNLNIQFLKMKLEKGMLNPELGKEILDSLEYDNKRAATIVKSLRSIFTEGESNTQEVQLGYLISSVLDIVKPELKSKNIQIQLRVDDDLLIQVNSAEIEQVILNLLNNAIQALAKSGTLQRHIAIEATKVGEAVRLSVSDNGPGVPADFKSHLFELLSTTKQTGMGLGLWLCKHIVTRYSGSIHHEDAIGGGAKFVVEFPPPLIGPTAN